ncbi:MAG: hypothetical protein ACK56K_13630 [Akkermansiaceae bacterium]
MENFQSRNSPTDFAEESEKIVRENISFVSLGDGDIFSILNYLNPVSKIKFTAMGDLNFTERIASLADGEFKSTTKLESYRWAAAVMAFLQIAEIDFYGDSSLLEFASANGQEEAREKFRAFHVINNIDPKFLINFALGRSNSIPVNAFQGIPEINPIPESDRFARKGNYYHINYTFMLKIALLTKDPMEPYQKVINLIDWMYGDFMFGAPALHFANLYFSPSRPKKMLKDITKKGISNAAWDLTLVQEWGKVTVDESGNQQPLLLITRDKAVKNIAGRLVALSEEEFQAQLISPWGMKTKYGRIIFNHYAKRWKQAEEDKSRNRKSYELLSKMKKTLETQLFG